MMKQIKQKLQQWLQWGKQLAERFDQAQRERDENEFLPAVLEVTEAAAATIAAPVATNLRRESLVSIGDSLSGGVGNDPAFRSGTQRIVRPVILYRHDPRNRRVGDPVVRGRFER